MNNYDELIKDDEIMFIKVRIELKDNILPQNIEVIGLSPEGNCIIKYTVESNVVYVNYKPEKKYYYYILFEVSNKSLLWIPQYELIQRQHWDTSIYTYDIKLTIYINRVLIHTYLEYSMALNYLIYDIFLAEPSFSNSKFTSKSIIPILDRSSTIFNHMDNFLITLFDYQKASINKMLEIENERANYTISYTCPINFKNINILFDPIMMAKNSKEHYFTIKSKGGILADEMGLGKTITSLALCVLNKPNIEAPTKYSKILDVNKINSKATLIICPSHLISHWISEIKKCYPSFNVLTILTKHDHSKASFFDFINKDIILVSHQFVMNFKYYPTLYYRPCTSTTFNIEHRNSIIKHHILDTIMPNIDNLTTLSCPIFEFFNFHRLILDEGHEIFGELSCASMSKYMSEWISHIDANYYWYLSGTPFITILGVNNCAKFIKLQLHDAERDILYDFGNNNYINKTSNNYFARVFMMKNYLWDNIFSKICIRHKADDISNELVIPSYDESIIWITLTELEQKLYDRKKISATQYYLQLLCCHPLIVESNKKIFGDIQTDLSAIQNKLIEYHKNRYEVYKNKIDNLDSSKQEYFMIKKNYESQMAESKYLFTILEKMTCDNVINEICSICMDTISLPLLTQCGHLFCSNCITPWIQTNKNCPICKATVIEKNIIRINSKQNTIESYIQKYGSKLGNLIITIHNILNDDNAARLIIFSQWDDMLSLIGKTLKENNINHTFVKGNIWARTTAIKNFKAGKDDCGNENKVIMLSLKNAASGSNLIEATHIIFVEPINSSKEEIKLIESQAIGRACRIGQENIVKIIRILIKNTIEEDIYSKYYA